MTVVYRYGCGPIPRETRLAIREQLWIAYRYKVMLWHLSMAGRNLYRELRRKHFPELVELELELGRVQELIGLLERDMFDSAEAFKAESQRLKVEKQHLLARLRALKLAAKEDVAFNAEVAAAQLKQVELGRALRKVFSRTFGLYSGTYLVTEAASTSANAGKEDPVRPRWNGGLVDGDGVLAIQLQGGRNVPTLMGGTDPSIHVEPPARPGKGVAGRTTVHYRLRSEEGKAVLISLPVQFSRPFPADTKVTWVKLVVSKVHERRFEYSVHFILESEFDKARRRGQGAGVVAVCFKGDEITLADEHGYREHLTPYAEPTKLRDLQSIRDKMRNETIGQLVGWLDRQDAPLDWVREEIQTIEERKSSRRLYHLCERMRREKVGSPELEKYLAAWAYRENHLYWWWACFTKNALRKRQDDFRVLASRLRKRYRHIVVDARKLNDPSRLDVDRRWRGLHSLRLTLKNAVTEDAFEVKGDSCEELLEAYRKQEFAEKIILRPKRTGFARKHAERRGSTAP